MTSIPARGPRPSWLAVGAATLLALAGCSQVTGLAAGTPNAVFAVQAAVTDVLTKQARHIQVAPVCTGTSVRDITCSQGKTLSGETIAVAVSGGADTVVKISVADKVVFEGPIAPVINEEGRSKP